MARQIRISPDQLQDWRIISSINISDVTSVINTMAKEKPTLKSGDYVVSKFKESLGDETKAKALFRQISAISDLPSLSGRPIDTVISDLYFSIGKELASESEIFSNLESIRKEISQLSDDVTIKLLAKARRISLDHDSILISTSTLTDIRPVFREDRDEILGSIILNYLKIDSIINGERKSLSLVLDEVDIQRLIDQLESAQRKIAAASSAVENKLGVRAMMAGEDGIAYD